MNTLYLAFFGIIAREKIVFISLKSTAYEAFTDVVHDFNDEVFVMNTCEDFGGDFVGFE